VFELRTSVAACLVAIASSLPTQAAEDPRLTEIVDILHEEGVIDDAQHHELAVKASRQQDLKDWTERISIWADFRARYEMIDFERDVYSRALEAADPTGASRLQDIHRARYQAHINMSGEVASRATVHFRLVSGDDNQRVALQTLGRDEDFDTDDIRFDLAYATISPFPDRELPGVDQGFLAVDLGKVLNPFRSKSFGPDKLLWDPDITLEGGSMRIRGAVGPVLLISHSGVYVIDENASSKDPKLASTQLGGSVVFNDEISAGARGTVYHFFSLDDAFFARTTAGGNLAGGLARRNGSVQVVEGSAFVALDYFELLPARIFASWVRNLSARSSPGASREANAYHVGLLVGDERTLARVGFGYYVIEANAFPSVFLDSVVLDGTPNRHGYEWTLRRELVPDVDFVFSAYLSDRIEGGVVYADSGPRSDRFRMRTDLIFDF
jgi:hypothetical protein